jgi:hypothetical protein
MKLADATAIPREEARLMQVALWNRGAPVKSQTDTMPPMLTMTVQNATAVARR